MAMHTSADEEKAAVRADIFNHLAGIVLAPTVKALSDRGALECFESSPGWVDLETIVERTHGTSAYLRIALRLLIACGWLRQKTVNGDRVASYALTPEGEIGFRLAPRLYSEVTSFIPIATFMEDLLFGKSQTNVAPFQSLVSRAKERWGLGSSSDPLTSAVQNRIRRHLDGMLVGPVMVGLAREGVLDRLTRGTLRMREIAGNPRTLDCVFDLLAAVGWIHREADKVTLTSQGQYAAQIATSYGVTVSYLPTFNLVSTLLFGNPRIPRFDESGVELLVNRAINVWGSGGAHKTYFRKVDEVIVEIFNRPIHRQPAGICDMGCGDGTLLEHLYTVIRDQTSRGPMMEKYPLLVVGADYNKVARRVSKQTLRQAGVPNHYVVHGDISRPAQLAGDLEKLGLDIHDLLHVRSFLDHNRVYSAPISYEGTRHAKSSGAFARLGDEVKNDELEENLVRHLRRWAPYVGRFGCLILELHTIPPEITAANLDRTPAVAYDGTHGFSDQYLVELPIFLELAREAGLQADPKHQFKFPPSELATVSINYFTAPPGSPAEMQAVEAVGKELSTI